MGTQGKRGEGKGGERAAKRACPQLCEEKEGRKEGRKKGFALDTAAAAVVGRERRRAAQEGY